MGLTYVPILKCKDAEKRALKQLPIECKKAIQPLLEIVPSERSDKVDEKVVYTPINQTVTMQNNIDFIIHKLYDIEVFLDIHHLDEVSVVEMIDRLLHPTTLFEHKITPVVVLENKSELLESKNLLLETIQKYGLCIRVFPKNKDVLALVKEIENFLNTLTLNKQDIHLLLDYEDSDSFADSAVELLTELRGSDQWKSVTIASGGAPKFLTGFSEETPEKVSRTDWETWRIINSSAKGVNYADYGIRCPGFEIIRNANTSPSLRYTTDTEWIIYKGKSKKAKGSKGSIQYRAHAMLLVDNPLYAGEEFSEGDQYIKSMANLDEEDIKKRHSGSSTTWLQAGTNHHLHMVIKQLEHLNNVQS